jgi:hypothetical protein
MTVIENIVDKLEAKRNGRGWIVKCPAHDDRKPSLSISQGADGRVLLKCHAGCETSAILAAIGYDMKDLFPIENGQTPAPIKAKATTSGFDWDTCVSRLTPDDLVRIGNERCRAPS